MNIDFQWNLQQVVDGIPRGVLAERAKRSFLYPHENIWPSEESRFLSIVDEIHENLTLEQRKNFFSACLASYLFNPNKAPQGFSEWFQTNTSIHELLGLEMSWEEVTSWNWGRVAIPGIDLIEGWNSKVIYAMVGCSREASTFLQLPTWANAFLNREAREAIEIAAELLSCRTSARGFLFWPMLDSSNSSSRIKGGSLGLPVYLSFFSLLANKSIPVILATGSLDKDGNLVEVGGLEEKLRLAHKKGFTSFIYPLLDGVKLLEPTGKVEPKGVQTLEQAECIWNGSSLNEPISISQITVSIPPQTVVNEVQELGEKLAGPIKEISSTSAELKRTLDHYKFFAVAGIVIIALVLLQTNTSVFQAIINGGENKASNTSSRKPLEEVVLAEGTRLDSQVGGTVTLNAKSAKNVDAGQLPRKVPQPHTPTGIQSQALVKAFNEINNKIDDLKLSQNDDNATTSGCFRVAKDLMVSGKLLMARKKYEECFKQNANYLDTLLDYQKLLKGLEGFEGARLSYGRLNQGQSHITIAFAGLLLDEPKVRYSKVTKFVEAYPSYAPAYYWMGMDCYDYYGKDFGCSDTLRVFVNLAKSVEADNYFFNKQILTNMISEANERLQ